MGGPKGPKITLANQVGPKILAQRIFVFALLEKRK